MIDYIVMSTVQLFRNYDVYHPLPLDIKVFQKIINNKQIEKHLKLKESLENIDQVYHKLAENIPLDLIEIPSNVKTQMLKYLKTDIKDIRPGKRFFNTMDFAGSLINCFLETRLSDFELDNKILPENKPIIKYLMDYVGQEIMFCFGLVRNYPIPEQMENLMFDKILQSKAVFVQDKSGNISLCINKHMGIVFGPGYMICIANYSSNAICLCGKKVLVLNSDDCAVINLVSRPDENFKINVGIKTQSVTQHMCCKCTDDNTGEIIYRYKDNMKTNIFMYHKKYTNGDEFEISNKNGLIVQTKHYWKQNISNIISQCTVTDNNTGLRYRGKVEINKTDEKITSKKLTRDNQVEYEESGEQVLVDKISRMNLTSEMIIGWKAVKNSNGEKRILKLGIPPDARTIIPIDEEYYLNNQKERADQAIVMDILLPDEEDEMSVVPHETTAYSYVYSKGPRFEYKIGQLVKPDGFDENSSIGCGKGIHFFREKANLFASYINGK